MILIELVAAIDAAGTLATFYLSTDGFVTSPTDTPPHVAFTPALLDPGSIGTHAYSDGKTSGGATKLEMGEVSIANADGRFDGWLNYSFDGRPITIRSGDGGAYPGSFRVVFAGTMESIEATWKGITIRLRDKQYVFSKPALTTSYTGANVLPEGLEGTAENIKGKVKPKLFGQVFNIPPVLVNTSKLTYQVNDGAVLDIAAVYDRGASVTKSTNYATGALLQAASVSAGTYSTCFAEGLFRLGTTASGQITADVTQGASAAARTTAQILRQIALLAGLPASEVSAADVAALDAQNSAVLGIWIDSDSTTLQSAMDQVAASIGAWYGFDGAGVLRMGVLTAPAGTPVLELRDYDVGDKVERRPARDNNIPSWRATVNHTRNWTVQTSDLAGVVTAPRRAYLALATRAAEAKDTAVKTKYLLAADVTVDSLLTTEAAAGAEAARQLALQKVRRDIFEVPVSINILTNNSLLFMDVVRLTLPRFGLDAGKLFRLIGVRIELSGSRAILTLWG